MHKAESIAEHGKRKLVLEFGLLEEILDFLRFIVVAPSAYTLGLSDSVSTRDSLDVLEMGFGLLTIDPR
jgi:hypothetical protein